MQPDQKNYSSKRGSNKNKKSQNLSLKGGSSKHSEANSNRTLDCERLIVDNNDQKSDSIRCQGIIQLPKDVDISNKSQSKSSNQFSKSSNDRNRKPIVVVRPNQFHANTSKQAFQSSSDNKKNIRPSIEQNKDSSQDKIPKSEIREVNDFMVHVIQIDTTLTSIIVQKPATCVQMLPEPLTEELNERFSIDGVSKINDPDENWPLVRSVFMRWWCMVYRLRTNLLNLYQQIILSDLDFCNTAHVEQGLWKSVYYTVVEILRTWIDNPSETGLISPAWSPSRTQSLSQTLSLFIREICINDVIKPGEIFLSRLLLAIQQNKHIHLGLIFNTKRPPPETKSRNRKLLYLSAQKLLLFLGDLARYQQLITGTKFLYQRAQLLVPKNGRPYNQLAVLALYTFIKQNRYFDAMLYYMKTLAASNPFPTASQSLSVLFNEMGKHAAKIVHEHCSNQYRISITNPIGSSVPQEGLEPGYYRPSGARVHFDARNRRAEIWYHPVDGTVTIVKGNRHLHIEARRACAIKSESKAPGDSREKEEAECSSDENEDMQDEVNEYANVPLIELNKKFGIFFITAHGNLFTKIGMEKFPEVASLVLQCFSGLLAQSPCPLSAERLCQILLVNMYNVDRAASLTSSRIQPHSNKDSSDHRGSRVSASQTPVVAPAQRFDAETLRSVHHDHASRLALDTMALVSRRASKLMQDAIDEFKADPERTKLNEELFLHGDLGCLLPALKLWSEWMVLHPEHWSPPPNHRDPTLRPCLDDWALLAEVCTKSSELSSLMFPNNPTYSECEPTTSLVLQESVLSYNLDRDIFPPLEEVGLTEQDVKYPLVIDDEELASRHLQSDLRESKYSHLTEEVWVAGFKPMLDMQPKMYKHNGEYSDEIMADYIRLQSLVLFGDYLCGIESPVLKYDVTNRVYRSVVEREMSERIQDSINLLKSPQNSSPHKNQLEPNKKDQFVNDELTNNLNDDMEDSEVRQLREQRTKLERKLAEERRLSAWRKFVIREAAADGQMGVEIEVRPIYILPDTNCYIDWLEGIACLAQQQSPYTILVPIVVLNELDKLAKYKSTSGIYKRTEGVSTRSRQVKLHLFDGSSSEDECSGTGDFEGITRSGLISGRARDAVAWLESEFDRRNPRLRALTSKGTMMDTISYRSEIHQSIGQLSVNDDIILGCCRHFYRDDCNDSSLSFSSQESKDCKTKPTCLRREIVLLTSDRNLRLKALNSNIPAPLLYSFVEWTGLPIINLGIQSVSRETKYSRKSRFPKQRIERHQHFPSLSNNNNN